MQGDDIMSSSNIILGSMYKQRSDMTYYFGLRRMNDSLLSENALLRDKLARLHEMDTLYDSSSRQIIKSKDSTHVVQYADYYYRTARVINNSVGAVNNFITINRGEKDGIRKNMAVVSGTGAVGRIVHTSAHFATAISILSKKQQVSARLKDGTIGYVIWEGKRPDELLMKDVPQQIKLKKGDTVYTTEYSFFPAGVMIGTVYRIDRIKSNNLRILHVRPSTNFRALQYVYVIENKLAKEKTQLEEAETE